MQAVAALPQVAGGGVASSTGVVSRRTGIYGLCVRLSKNLLQQRIYSCSSSKFPISRKQIRSPGNVGLGNVVVRAENEVLQEVGKDHEQQGEFTNVHTLVQADMGRIALAATLLLGVGTLATTGSAEAATGHLRDGLHLPLDTDLRALAMGPEGPILEEFWDNMRRYGLYFLTVASGGIYSLIKPLIDALRNPLTAVLVIIVVTGTIYLVGLTVSAMLGVNEFQYEYAP